MNGNGSNGNGGAAAIAAHDTVIAFSIPARNARGRIARIGPALTAILSAHDYPEPLCHLLGEALVLTILIGTTLQKEDGQTTLQAQAKDGVVNLLVCDYRAGEIRGYLGFDPEKPMPQTGAPLDDFFGEGYLAITLEQASADERYQGIVPLEGRSLSAAVQGYFSGSEQVPTLCRATVAPNKAGGWNAGGLLLQYLPHGEAGNIRLSARDDLPDWDHVLALATTVTGKELTDADLPLEDLLWRLFNEDEVRVVPAIHISRGCRCSPQHIRDVISRFSDTDIAEMRDDNGVISVNCEFCARIFPIDI